jgi:flagellar hook-length control protein FliK
MPSNITPGASIDGTGSPQPDDPLALAGDAPRHPVSEVQAPQPIGIPGIVGVPSQLGSSASVPPGGSSGGSSAGTGLSGVAGAASSAGSSATSPTTNTVADSSSSPPSTPATTPTPGSIAPGAATTPPAATPDPATATSIAPSPATTTPPVSLGAVGPADTATIAAANAATPKPAETPLQDAKGSAASPPAGKPSQQAAAAGSQAASTAASDAAAARAGNDAGRDQSDSQKDDGEGGPPAVAHRSVTPDTHRTFDLAATVATSQPPATAGHAATPDLSAIAQVTGTATPPTFTVVAASAVAAPADAAGGTGVPLEGLAVEIATRSLEGKRRFEIRLDPPELGRIDVRLDVGRDGQVTSRLVVERAETLDLLRRDAGSLERALQSTGLRTDDGGMQFSLRDQSGGRYAGSDDTRSPNMLIVPDENVAVREAVRRGYGVLRGIGRGVDIRV